ncbi:CLUMA_CG012513, isoform A [Clunio marinus]|uniref:CLUMA_CG012513, isoform A n=1 Tax=Clunio marinus TaxID=568069 RepID=A0A1J1IHF7_9DIPT|nr:CLUMA_CG012513, isoform A [Clunio marinus]
MIKIINYNAKYIIFSLLMTFRN